MKQMLKVIFSSIFIYFFVSPSKEILHQIRCLELWCFALGDLLIWSNALPENGKYAGYKHRKHSIKSCTAY